MNDFNEFLLFGRHLYTILLRGFGLDNLFCSRLDYVA